MKHKNATIIVGASSGIGKKLALIESMKRPVCLLARRTEKIQALKNKIEEMGGKALAITCDVTDKTQCQNAIKKALQWAQVTRFIYNTGVALAIPLNEFKTETFNAVFQPNFHGLIHCLEFILPEFIAKKQGHIVGISSLASLVSGPASSSYCASKTAMNVILTSIRRESKSIDVSIICPGFIKTALTDQNDFKMPLLMPLDKAAKKIHHAIEKKIPFYAFPKPAYWALRCLSKFPLRIEDWLIAKQKYKKKS